MLFLLILHVLIAFVGLTWAAQEPKFTVTMDLYPDDEAGTDVRTQYKNMLQEIRRGMYTLNPAATIQGVGILPPQTDEDNPPVFDLRLLMEDQLVTFRIRADNFYVIGFRRHNEDQWFETRRTDSTVHRIQGSTLLEFTDTYLSMERASGIIGGREHINLGLGALLTRLEDLLRPGTGSNLIATAFIVVVEMMAEAARNRRIENWVANNLGVDQPLPPVLHDWENDWKKGSEAVLDYPGPNPDGTFPPLRIALQENNQYGLHEYVDLFAALALAIIPVGYRGVVPGWLPGSKGGVGRRSIHGGSLRSRQDGVALVGRTLVEIFDVSVWKSDGTPPGLVHGIVDTNDHMWHYPIFNSNKDEAEDLSSTGYNTLTLQGPIRALSAADDWLISVDLKDKNDHYLAIGAVQWYSRPEDGEQHFGEVKSQEIFSQDKSSYATVTWAVVQNAAEAIINIVLNAEEATGTLNLKGTIFAQTDTFPDSRAIIFDSTINGHAKTLKWVAPDIARSVVVSMDGTLTVDADVSDGDLKLVDGNVHFDKPKINKSEVKHITLSSNKNIVSDSRSVEVRVTWR